MRVRPKLSMLVRVERGKVLNSVIFNLLLLIDPNARVILNSSNVVTSPYGNIFLMKICGILIPKTQPILARFLKPNDFFLTQNFLQLNPKLLFKIKKLVGVVIL